MKTLFPAASACFVVAFVASVGLAESSLEATANRAGETVSEQPRAESSASADSESSAKPKRAELSVAPMDHVTYPDDRPGWIETEPDLQSPVHSWVVTTSGAETMEQCEAELEVLKPAAVALYIKETTGWLCDDAFLDQQWIEDELIDRRYLGTLKMGDRELYEIAVELKFDADSRKRIRRAMNNSVVGERLRATAGLFALALVGLCCTGGVLGVFSRRYAS
ncbi:hypothetical protein Enr13x_47310 [Stieleria neptunia]|uniref:Transmembrane protein n=1 Tax=Stieleria neptunia TaxID=2527979 RepID=A0A518HVI5_9BACT|nr:hypothetical protein [Stieleria neptunia]QDV44860.1 hypothetical protein Enr13x_47310 [Stieleria neptunia]